MTNISYLKLQFLNKDYAFIDSDYIKLLEIEEIYSFINLNTSGNKCENLIIFLNENANIKNNVYGSFQDRSLSLFDYLYLNCEIISITINFVDGQIPVRSTETIIHMPYLKSEINYQNVYQKCHYIKDGKEGFIITISTNKRFIEKCNEMVQFIQNNSKEQS